MHDASEMVSYTKQSFKLASQVSFAIKSQEGITMGPTFPGTKQLGSAGQDSKVKTTGNYSAAGYLNLKPDETIQMFKNEHPGSSFDPMMSYLARDIAWGVDVSPDVLWDITAAGGAGVRYSVADTQVFIEQLQRLLIDVFCRRFYKFWLWHEIEAGRIQNAPADWYRVEWVTPRKLTVDFGRDSKALMDMVTGGRMSSRRFAEMHGWELEQEDRDSARAVARRKRIVEEVAKEEGVELGYGEVFGGGNGGKVVSDQFSVGSDAGGGTGAGKVLSGPETES
jgi:capsid protein